MFRNRETTARNMPGGYEYRYTGYADKILESEFPSHFRGIRDGLDDFYISWSELLEGGGNQTELVKRLTKAIAAGIDEIGLSIWLSEAEEGLHKVDLFAQGIALEVEWNNKDPFFHRDLMNFDILYRRGRIKAGVIVTRGPDLQRLLEEKGPEKFGKSTTHWDKLMPIVNETWELGMLICPLMLIGIQADRITGNKHRSWQPSLFGEEYE